VGMGAGVVASPSSCSPTRQPPDRVRKLVDQVPTDGCRNGKTPFGVALSIDISMA